jgi:hypothetical protein
MIAAATSLLLLAAKVGLQLAQQVVGLLHAAAAAHMRGYALELLLIHLKKYTPLLLTLLRGLELRVYWRFLLPARPGAL